MIERADKANRSAWKASAESLVVRSRARRLRMEHAQVRLATRPSVAGPPIRDTAIRDSAIRDSAIRDSAIRDSAMGPGGPMNGPVSDDTGCLFELTGTVSGTLVEANFTPHGLTCDPLLRAHAELVVALGETFPYGDGLVLPAALDGSPAQILLTLMRAMKVTGLRVCLGPQPKRWMSPTQDS